MWNGKWQLKWDFIGVAPHTSNVLWAFLVSAVLLMNLQTPIPSKEEEILSLAYIQPPSCP